MRRPRRPRSGRVYEGICLCALWSVGFTVDAVIRAQKRQAQRRNCEREYKSQMIYSKTQNVVLNAYF